jgi:ABC-2 type transport system ATP-binding protein
MRRRYLRRKVIDLRLREAREPDDPWLDLPGVSVVKAKGFGIKLEVDTDLQPIAGVVGTLMAALPIADITIEDAPLEEIIAAIYRDRRRATSELVDAAIEAR